MIYSCLTLGFDSIELLVCDHLIFQVWNAFPSSWTAQNSILVDDSPKKHVRLENALIIPTYDVSLHHAHEDTALRQLRDYLIQMVLHDPDDVRLYMQQHSPAW